MYNLRNIIDAASNPERAPSTSEILAFCEKSGWSPEEFCNQFSISIAESYSKGDLSYELCDIAMNFLYGFMTSRIMSHPDENIAEPAYSIYSAFDAGEYCHNGDSADIDPVEKYTKPAINALLRALNNS